MVFACLGCERSDVFIQCLCYLSYIWWMGPSHLSPPKFHPIPNPDHHLPWVKRCGLSLILRWESWLVQKNKRNVSLNHINKHFIQLHLQSIWHSLGVLLYKLHTEWRDMWRYDLDLHYGNYRLPRQCFTSWFTTNHDWRDHRLAICPDNSFSPEQMGQSSR